MTRLMRSVTFNCVDMCIVYRTTLLTNKNEMKLILFDHIEF
jgi:hypothetical protein